MGGKANGKQVQLTVLGTFELHRDGRILDLAQPARSLIALLAVFERSLGRERAAGMLWPDETTDSALKRMRSTLWKAKQTDGGQLILANRTLTLSPDITVDLDTARAAADRLLREPHRVGESDLDISRFKRDVLPDWYDAWIVPEREAFHQVRLHALEAIASRLLATDQHCQALEACLLVVDAEPFRESAHRLIAEIHLAEGNPAQALGHFEAYRKALAAELNITPGAALTDLAEAIRTAHS